MRGVGLELLGAFKYLDGEAEQDTFDDEAKQDHVADDPGSKKNFVDMALRLRRQAIRANLVGYIAVVSYSCFECMWQIRRMSKEHAVDARSFCHEGHACD